MDHPTTPPVPTAPPNKNPALGPRRPGKCKTLTTEQVQLILQTRRHNNGKSYNISLQPGGVKSQLRDPQNRQRGPAYWGVRSGGDAAQAVFLDRANSPGKLFAGLSEHELHKVEKMFARRVARQLINGYVPRDWKDTIKCRLMRVMKKRNIQNMTGAVKTGAKTPEEAFHAYFALEMTMLVPPGCLEKALDMSFPVSHVAMLAGRKIPIVAYERRTDDYQFFGSYSAKLSMAGVGFPSGNMNDPKYRSLLEDLKPLMLEDWRAWNKLSPYKKAFDDLCMIPDVMQTMITSQDMDFVNGKARLCDRDAGTKPSLAEIVQRINEWNKTHEEDEPEMVEPDVIQASGSSLEATYENLLCWGNAASAARVQVQRQKQPLKNGKEEKQRHIRPVKTMATVPPSSVCPSAKKQEQRSCSPVKTMATKAHSGICSTAKKQEHARLKARKDRKRREMQYRFHLAADRLERQSRLVRSAESQTEIEGNHGDDED